MVKQFIIKDGCPDCGKTIHLVGSSKLNGKVICSECLSVRETKETILQYERDFSKGFKCVICNEHISPHNNRCNCVIDNDKYCI